MTITDRPHITVTGHLQKEAWRVRELPPVELVRPGLWSIPVIFPNNPLRYVNVYVIEVPNGIVLVDAGWPVDEAWKKHLRKMDELKTSVQLAVHEQKDPLLIYKIESFELFGKMLTRINTQVLGMLFRARIHAENEVSEARPALKRQDPKIQTSRPEMESLGGDMGSSAAPSPEMSAPRPTQNPIINDLKIGRNDPCPCGSGKKFKACHGKD